MGKSDYMVLEKTKRGNLFPVGSVLEINGELVFWRDFDATKFLFKKGNYTAIYQDDVVIRFLETAGVKDIYFRDFRRGKIYKTALEQYKTARPVDMRGRKQRGLNLMRFDEPEGFEIPKHTRPEDKVVIEA